MRLFTNIKRKLPGVGRYGSLFMAVVFVITAFHAAPAQTQDQWTFATPEEAVTALVEAVKANDTLTLLAIFGPGSEEIITSGDPEMDKAVRERFITRYEEKNSLEKTSPDRMIFYIGNDDWPFPIPLVREEETWRYDTASGKDEILARRIGRNELSAIQTCLAYVDAQREYALQDHDGDGILVYASKLMSDPGKKNGLYWKTAAGEEQSPLGPLVAAAHEKGYRMGTPDAEPAPYHGYYYRILDGQGKHADGGAQNYILNGRMIGGFALVAFPATYGSTGVMTFIVNYEGVVYQKDLGENTEKTALAMKLFDPDDTWQKVSLKTAEAK